MRISKIELESQGGQDLLSGEIDGFRVWFRITPGGSTQRAAEPFLIVALLGAMVSGEPLDVAPDWTVSPKLLDALDRMQEILSTWNPRLGRVPVTARPGPPPPPRDGVATFFSGGVDSMYTFADRQDEISHLILMHGFDYRLENHSLAEETERENRRFAATRQRELVVVESNFRELFDAHRLSWVLSDGPSLGAVAVALGFARCYVPASMTWRQLMPWGSHPLTDPLWSTESVEIVHHGVDARRTDKLRRIAELPGALALLRVCYTSPLYNCGACEKCLRTRAGLRLLELSSARLPPLDDLRPVRNLGLKSAVTREFWEETLEAAVQAGDRALARAITRPLARYDARRALRSFDRAYLGSFVRSAIPRLRSAVGRGASEPDEIGVVPPDVGKV